MQFKLGLHNKGHNWPPAFQASQCITGTHQHTHHRVRTFIRCVTVSNSWNFRFQFLWCDAVLVGK